MLINQLCNGLDIVKLADTEHLTLLLMTRQLDFKISRMTLQMSLNTTLLELLLCNNFPIFLVLSNNCTLLICYPPDCQEKISPISQKPITVTF